MPPAEQRPEITTKSAAALHSLLEEDFPEIERGIYDFLVQRGGAASATEGLRISMATLRRHIYLEEEFLFPALTQADLAGPVFAMSKDHRELWVTLDRMQEHLDEGSSASTQQKVGRILRAEVDRHVSKEVPIVFSQAEDALSEPEQEDLKVFIGNVTLPEGWVCPNPEFD